MPGDILTDCVVVNYRAQDRDNCIHFLTHIDPWFRKIDDVVSPTAPVVYTSKFNAWYLEALLNAPKNKFIGLSVGKNYKFVHNGKKIIFALFDSYYITGSIMILLMDAHGVYLYTGCSNFPPKVYDFPVMQQIRAKEGLTRLFLDVTYLDHPSDFVTFSELTHQLIELVKSFQVGKTFIHMQAWGLEMVLIELARALGELIVVDEQRMLMLKVLECDYLFTCDATHGNVVVSSAPPRRGCTQWHQIIILEREARFLSKFHSYIFENNRHYFKFYCHNSDKQCAEIINTFRPDIILPVNSFTNTTRNKILGKKIQGVDTSEGVTHLAYKQVQVPGRGTQSNGGAEDEDIENFAESTKHRFLLTKNCPTNGESSTSALPPSTQPVPSNSEESRSKDISENPKEKHSNSTASVILKVKKVDDINKSALIQNIGKKNILDKTTNREHLVPDLNGFAQKEFELAPRQDKIESHVLGTLTMDTTLEKTKTTKIVENIEKQEDSKGKSLEIIPRSGTTNKNCRDKNSPMAGEHLKYVGELDQSKYIQNVRIPYELQAADLQTEKIFFRNSSNIPSSLPVSKSDNLRVMMENLKYKRMMSEGRDYSNYLSKINFKQKQQKNSLVYKNISTEAQMNSKNPQFVKLCSEMDQGRRDTQQLKKHTNMDVQAIEINKESLSRMNPCYSKKHISSNNHVQSVPSKKLCKVENDETFHSPTAGSFGLGFTETGNCGRQVLESSKKQFTPQTKTTRIVKEKSVCDGKSYKKLYSSPIPSQYQFNTESNNSLCQDLKHKDKPGPIKTGNNSFVKEITPNTLHRDNRVSYLQKSTGKSLLIQSRSNLTNTDGMNFYKERKRNIDLSGGKVKKSAFKRKIYIKPCKVLLDKSLRSSGYVYSKIRNCYVKKGTEIQEPFPYF